MLQLAPDLARPRLAGEVEVATRLDDWSRNELLLLERGDPEALRLIGESRSEALGVMRETMRSYTRGNWTGRGFLAGRVSPQIRTTATREHMVTGLLASQWGLLGTLGLVGMLLGVVAPISSRHPRPAGSSRPAPLVAGLIAAAGLTLVAVVLPSPANALVLGAVVAAGLGAALASALLPGVRGIPEGLATWLWDDPGARAGEGDAPSVPAGPPANPFRILSAAALVSFSAAGLYMILANYGLVLFTGKNVYLLGLDSLSDTIEALALIGIGVGALGLAEEAAATGEKSASGASPDGPSPARPHGPAPDRDLVPSAPGAKRRVQPGDTPRIARRAR